MKNYICYRARKVHENGIKLFYIEWGIATPYKEAETELMKKIAEDKSMRRFGKSFVLTEQQLSKMAH